MVGTVGSVPKPAQELEFTPSALSAAFNLLGVISDVEGSKKLLKTLAKAKQEADAAIAQAAEHKRAAEKLQASVARREQALKQAQETFDSEAESTRLAQKSTLDEFARTKADHDKAILEKLADLAGQKEELDARDAALQTKEREVANLLADAQQDRAKAQTELKKAEAMRTEVDAARKRAQEFLGMQA